MQKKLGTIALGVLGASLVMTETSEAQTTLPGVTVESSRPRQAGGGGGSPQVAAPAPVPAAPVETPAAASGNPANAIDGYVAESTATGTKTNSPLREIPQSVSVVTRDQIEDRGAQTLAEALGYSSGVAVNPYGLDSRFDQFIIRGFEQNTTGVYRDGLRLPTFSFTSFRIEPEGVDHIDIMRGPTSGLYGLNNPGGMVNVVSKMPTEEAFGEIWASYGTWDAKAVGFDVGGPAANGKLQYRVTGVLRDADTQVDFVENDRFYIAPALTFKPTEATTFTILANYQKDNLGDTFQLLPAEAVLDGTIPRGTFLGEPDFSKLKGEQWGIGYQFEHRFTPAVTFRQNLRYDHASTDYHTIYPAGGSLVIDPLTGAELFPGLTLLNGQDADETIKLFQVDNQLQFDSRVGSRIENTLLVGFDYSHFTSDNTLGFGGVKKSDSLFGPADPAFYQNPSDPRYGGFSFFSLGDPTFTSLNRLPTVIDRETTQETAGLYFQDQIKLDKRWVFTLGGRYDWVETGLDDRLGSGDSSSDDEAFTYRVGMNYLFDNGLTPFASYSTSFAPVPLTSTGGLPLSPEEGEQYEVGIKYQPKGSKSWVQMALFDLTKQNATNQNEFGTFFQTGEIQVLGFEAEATLDLDNGWKVLGAFDYWDAEITGDIIAANVGNRPARIPEYLASLWLDYTFRTGPFKGLGLGVGVRYFGETFGDIANVYDVPHYTLFDAAIRYEWSQWKLSLNVGNVFDEDYAGTCGSVNVAPGLLSDYEYCSYGKGRNATVRVGYRW